MEKSRNENGVRTSKCRTIGWIEGRRKEEEEAWGLGILTRVKEVRRISECGNTDSG